MGRRQSSPRSPARRTPTTLSRWPRSSASASSPPESAARSPRRRGRARTSGQRSTTATSKPSFFFCFGSRFYFLSFAFCVCDLIRTNLLLIFCFCADFEENRRTRKNPERGTIMFLRRGDVSLELELLRDDLLDIAIDLLDGLVAPELCTQILKRVINAKYTRSKKKNEFVRTVRR